MPLPAAALITAGCGGSNSSDNVSVNTSSSQPSAVGPSDMSNEQAPPARLIVDVTIKGGKVTPTNEQLKAGVKEQIVVRINSDAVDELHVHSTPDHSSMSRPGRCSRSSSPPTCQARSMSSCTS